MKKIFTLFLAAACCTMVFGKISVTDNSLADWDNLPAEYVSSCVHQDGCSYDGLKSMKVYADMQYINLLVEYNPETVTDLGWTPFHIGINTDNSDATGGFGDWWSDANTDIMLETAVFESGTPHPYNPHVFQWWGAVGENGWLWTNPNVEHTYEDCWGALICEGSTPAIGNSQVIGNYIEIQINYSLIPADWNTEQFTLGVDIEQYWNTVGLLPNAADDELGSSVLAEKLLVKINNVGSLGYRTNIDGLWYEITDEDTHTVAVVWERVPSGEISSYSNLTEANIPSSITIDDISYSVTSIDDYAFYHCKNLTSVTIPNTVISIGEGAFDGCESIATITIPNSVTSIGKTAFAWCTNLTSVTIPNSVTSMGTHVFQNCTSLPSVTIPNSLTSIADYTFFHCKQLTSVTIPNTVTSIGEGAFDGCESIATINIPNSVTNIGEAAFAWCTGLTSVTAPAIFFEIDWIKYTKLLSNVEVKTGELTDIALEFIKRSQKSLKVLNLTATSHKTIADKAFEGYYNLDSLYFPSQLTAIPYMAMAECVNLKSITMPATVEYIDSRAFENCRLLSEVNFAENGALTEIGNWAFYNCHELKEIAIPEGVTSIGYAAFYGCTYLKELTLPASMQSVADNGFALCEKLEKMNINASLPPVVDARTFENVNRAIPVFVPADAVAQYKAAPVWQEFNIKSNATSDLENTNSQLPTSNIQKLIHNGQLIILRDGKTYNVMGQEL